ncbi:hypothetical protein CHS0354_009972 [Potamilus streckersoni]|uniref:Uncharacterized protein n=1 Tax=Potamilus streckersoni TaxID=2493646 RepID=A0AAE0TBM2_9BIVA|nr:hypothetical protein CHS0354_009972 [Potamilus streckersoni]
MAQSSYNTCTVKDRDRKSYEDSWETKMPHNQRYLDLRSVTYHYQQPMSQYHGDNRTYFGQYSMIRKDNSGQKYLSHGNTENNKSIANDENLRVLRPQLSRPLAVPGSTPPPKSRPSPPLFQPPSSRSKLPSAISRPLTPTCQPPPPRPKSLLPTSRPPTPRPRLPTPRPRPPTPRPQSPSLRCQPPSQQTQTMHSPLAFTYNQFQIQHGNQIETHNYSSQQTFCEDGGYWNHPEICYKDSYYVPPSRKSGVQPLYEKETNEENYFGPRQMLINGTKHASSEYSIQTQINERRRVSTSTYPPTQEHNQNSVEYFQQNGRNKNEPSAQLTFLPIEEISQTKYEKNKSSVLSCTVSLKGQSESRRVIRTDQYRKAPYATKRISTPTNIRLRSTGTTSETESNMPLPIHGSLSPLPCNVHLLHNCDTNAATNQISGQRSQEQSFERQGNMHISQSGIVTPFILASYLEDGTASKVYPAMSLDSDRRVVIQCSKSGGTVGADTRLKYDRVLPGCQISQQWAKPLKQCRNTADRNHTTSWGKYSDLANDMHLGCQEPNQKYTDWHPVSEGDQNFPNSTKKTFISTAIEQYSDSQNDICKTAVMDEIHTEISTPSIQSNCAFNKAKELRSKHLQTEETLHLLKGTGKEENASNTTGITDSPKAAESKDGPQNNPTIVALIDRLLK